MYFRIKNLITFALIRKIMGLGYDIEKKILSLYFIVNLCSLFINRE